MYKDSYTAQLSIIFHQLIKFGIWLHSQLLTLSIYGQLYWFFYTLKLIQEHDYIDMWMMGLHININDDSILVQQYY